MRKYYFVSYAGNNVQGNFVTHCEGPLDLKLLISQINEKNNCSVAITFFTKILKGEYDLWMGV